MSSEFMESLYNSILNYNERNSYMKLVVCNILGYSEDHMYNQLMGDLYEKYLRLNSDTKSLLIEEFMITPMVIDAFIKLNEVERKSFATEILDGYIKPIIIFVNNENYESAAMMFAYMNRFVKDKIKYNNELLVDEETNGFRSQNVYIKKHVS